MDEFEAAFDFFPIAEQQSLDQIKELERRVSSEPHNVQVWLEYSTAHIAKKARHTASSASVALAVLEKALSINTKSAALHLAYIRTAAEIWSSDKIASRWADVLRLFPIVQDGQVCASMEIWYEYLGWCEGAGVAVVQHQGKQAFDAVTLIYEGIIRDIRAVALVTKGRSGNERANIDERTEELLLYLFQRYALFMRHTGKMAPGMANGRLP